MDLSSLKVGMQVEIESPDDVRRKEQTIANGFRPIRNIGKIIGTGVHSPVANDVGVRDMVTVDMGGGCHVYCHHTWLKPVV